MIKYSLDFILHVHDVSAQTLTNSLTEFSEGLRISEKPLESGSGVYFTMNMRAEDPTLIFDICSQFGRIKSVKVDEIRV
ncbi:MAG: hypothetical protein Q8O22_00480 [Candidatus Omnitrophota bacterium]|nr:hypothetical protein [Candidatus Omnitrophota bacterium]